MSEPRRHVAVFLYGLTSGGAPRRALTLAEGFAARGHRVDVVVADASGPLARILPDSVRLVELDSVWRKVPGLGGVRRFQVRAAVFALAAYLRREQPDVLMSGANTAHLTAVWAHALARSHARLVLRVCTHLSGTAAGGGAWRRPVLRPLARRFFPRADAVIAGSHAVAQDVIAVTGMDSARITTVPNPVVSPELERRARQPLDHPWLAAGSPPVILGIGRIVAQKDFPTLIRAFARVRAEREARLIILGEAKSERRRHRLHALAQELGVADDVALPGLVENPYAYLARASVFALSSAWEGLSGVLIEAMACGCPVVSTDSPGGSAEILAHGQYGPLVPVGDDAALARAIATVLDHAPDRAQLVRRAHDFGVAESVERYAAILFPERAAEVAA